MKMTESTESLAMTLDEALHVLNEVTPARSPWTGWDVSGEEEARFVDHAIAAILNAALSGDLVKKDVDVARIAVQCVDTEAKGDAE